MKQYIITERDVGLASLFFQVINALNRCEKEELGTPIVYFKNQCVYYNPEGHQNKDNVWEYYFRPVVETADTLMISDKIKGATFFRTIFFLPYILLNGLHQLSSTPADMR